MKFDLSKEWCMKAAEAEGNYTIGAGATMTPNVSRYVMLENVFIKARDAGDEWLVDKIGDLMDFVWATLTKEEQAILKARL